MSNVVFFVDAIKTLKITHGNQYFKKLGLHAVLNDLSPGIDKKFLNVLKKADDFSLCIKIGHLENENESFKTIELAKYRQDFVENSGLDNMLAVLIFDTYLFGLDLMGNLKSENYRLESHNPILFLEELIDMALVDNKLEKSEVKIIFSKCQQKGLTEDDIFCEFVKAINHYHLKPLNAHGSVKLTDKSILLQYDWVDEKIIKQMQPKQISDVNDADREKVRLAYLQQEQSLAAQKGKESELEKLELEKLEKQKTEEKAKTEGVSIEQEKKEKAEEERRYQKAQEEEKKIKEEERERQQRLEQYEKLPDWQKPMNQHLLKSNKEVKALKVSSIIIIPIVVIGLVILLLYIFKSNTEVKDLDAKLSKQYEVINGLILQNKLDSALSLVPGLVHPSFDCREYNKPNDCKNTFSDYWGLKRAELTEKIEEKINSRPKVQAEPDIQADTHNFIVEDSVYIIDDPDGYTNVRNSPNGDIIGQVDDGTSIEVVDQSGDWWKVKLDSGEEGFMHKSRIKLKK
jgi:hypothetical protein